MCLTQQQIFMDNQEFLSGGGQAVAIVSGEAVWLAVLLGAQVLNAGHKPTPVKPAAKQGNNHVEYVYNKDTRTTEHPEFRKMKSLARKGPFNIRASQGNNYIEYLYN